jgi:hypothetical protein
MPNTIRLKIAGPGKRNLSALSAIKSPASEEIPLFWESILDPVGRGNAGYSKTSAKRALQPFVSAPNKLVLEGCNRFLLIRIDVEDGGELGDLHQVIHLLGQIKELEFTALVPGGSESAGQFAHA